MTATPNTSSAPANPGACRCAELSPHQPTPRPAPLPLNHYTAAALHELLNLAEEFLRTASPTVHAELRTYLRTQVPPADPAWFIDMLGFNAANLVRHLPTTAPALREAWAGTTGANIHDDKWGQIT